MDRMIDCYLPSQQTRRGKFMCNCICNKILAFSGKILCACICDVPFFCLLGQSTDFLINGNMVDFTPLTLGEIAFLWLILFFVFLFYYIRWLGIQLNPQFMGIDLKYVIHPSSFLACSHLV